MKLLSTAGGLLIVGCLTAAALTGCSTGPDAAACKSAMAASYAHALAHPSAPAASRPATCQGVPAATLRKFAGEIAASALASPASTPASGPSATPQRVTAAEIATQLGATGVNPQPVAPGTAESSEALASYHGHYIVVSTFASAANRARWESADPTMTVIGNDSAPDGTLYAVTDGQ